MQTTPRMRTILEAAAELKAMDPHTAVTLHAIRRMVKAGEIPHVDAGRKQLINLDKLIEHLSNPTPPAPAQNYGTIRRISERRA